MREIFNCLPIFRKRARAKIRGGPLAPQIKGVLYIKDVADGAFVTVKVKGLPPYQPASNDEPVGPHGFHIHQVGDCTVSDPEDPFRRAEGHYNPDNQPHGNHAGDLPNLFSNNGRAQMSLYTNRFKVDDVLDRAVIIHKNPNDFRTQPAGNAGPRLACGIITQI